MRFLVKENVQHKLVGKVECTAFEIRKNVMLLGFLDYGETINSESYSVMLTQISGYKPEEKKQQQPFF